MSAATSITVTCVRATDDRKQDSHEYQEELQYLADTINGSPVSQPILWPTPEGGNKGWSGVFNDLRTELLDATTVIVAFSIWLASHEGRILLIQIGDVEAEANSKQKLEVLLTDPRKIKWATDSKRA